MMWKKSLPLIGIALFVYILIKLDISKIIKEITNVNLFYLLISLIFVGLFLFTQTLKWFVIARKQKINVPFLEAFKINLISDFYGFITPSKIGGLIRAKYLKKYTENIGKGISNFTLDKLLDIISVFFIAIIFLFIFKKKFPGLPVEFFAIVLISLILIMFIFLKKERSKSILMFFYNKMVPKKMKEKAKLTFNSFYEDLPKKRHFILFFIINLLSWINVYIIAFFVGKALGINLPFVYFLTILPIGTLVSLIPITINGLGTREATLISLFALFGVSAEKVFSMSILNIVISGIVPAIIAIFLIFKKEN